MASAFKRCPQCEEQNAVRRLRCTKCGHNFGIRSANQGVDKKRGGRQPLYPEIKDEVCAMQDRDTLFIVFPEGVDVRDQCAVSSFTGCVRNYAKAAGFDLLINIRRSRRMLAALRFDE